MLGQDLGSKSKRPMLLSVYSGETIWTLFFKHIFHLQMASGQTGVSGVIVPVVELKLGLDHATIHLQPMEDKIAHPKMAIQLNGLKTS
jgi:hypothetical protein